MQSSQHNTEGKEQSQRIDITGLKTVCKVILCKTVWYWEEKKKDTLNNGTEDIPETDPHKYSQQPFDKGAKVFHGEKIVFSINGAGTTVYLTAK